MNDLKLFKSSNPKVVITVKNFGKITLELFREIAPKTVENFLSLVKDDFYTNLIFHRIIPGFMIQGGAKKTAQTIVGEFDQNGIHNPLQHRRGVISMARTQDPNSASSQFFIMHQDAPHLDGSYAAFGAVTKGMDVVDQMVNQPRDKNDKPYEDIVIKEITIL